MSRITSFLLCTDYLHSLIYSIWHFSLLVITITWTHVFIFSLTRMQASRWKLFSIFIKLSVNILFSNTTDLHKAAGKCDINLNLVKMSCHAYNNTLYFTFARTFFIVEGYNQIRHRIQMLYTDNGNSFHFTLFAYYEVNKLLYC